MEGSRPGARLVDRVRDAVDAHTPAGEREARSRRLILAVLAVLPRPFDRHAAETHITGSAVISGPAGTVLHLHKKTGTWLQPGGHLEAGEAPWEAALREATEETGLAVRHPQGEPRLIHVDVHPAPGAHVHLDLRYLLEAGGGQPRPAPGESPVVRWFGWPEALRTTDPSCRAALLSARTALHTDR